MNKTCKSPENAGYMRFYYIDLTNTLNWDYFLILTWRYRIMGIEAINGYSPLIQQTQPQVRTQVQEQNQSQSEIANQEAAGGFQNIDLKVEAADNSSGSNNNDSGSSAQNFTKAQTHLQETEEQIQADNEKIRKTISEMTKKMSPNAEAVFGIHDKTNRVTIKMVDKDTKKVIKEFPPDETLDMIAKIWEIAGIMVDEKR
jgi:flagellar protein FlaG